MVLLSPLFLVIQVSVLHIALIGATTVLADTSWYGNTYHGEEFVSVTKFGAKGDGISDDTDALQRAINYNRVQSGLPPPPTQRPFAPPRRAIVYLPPGTYVVSDTLVLWFFTHLRGNTINPPTLLLASSTPGFGNASALKPILATAGGCNQSVPWWLDNFHANDMFYNQIHSINIKVGSGNEGAVGLYWSIAQQTSIRDLNIEGASVGIDVAVTRGYATPLHSSAGLGGGGTIEDVVILGGNYGMRVDGSQYTIRGVTFKDQKVASIQVAGNVWTFAFASIQASNSPLFMEVLSPGYSDTNVLLLDVAMHNITGPAQGASAAISLPREGISLVLENVTLAGSLYPNTIVSAGSESWIGLDRCTRGGYRNVYRDSYPNGYSDGYRDGYPNGYQNGYSDGYRDEGITCHVDRWAGYGGQTPGHKTPNGIWLRSELQKAARQRLPGARVRALPKRSRPWFDHLPLSTSLDVSSRDSICNAVTTCNATGDNSTDDTNALQLCLDRCKAVFLPSGVYRCTDTLKLNARTVLIGEALSQLYLTQSAHGFGRPQTPKVFVDTPDDPGGEVMITDVSMQAGWGNDGAVMMRWRVGPASGMWDVHINISHNVHIGLHVTGSGAGVISNMWGWGADHSQWTGEHMSQDAADIGFLGDSQGPLWCFGVAFEHHRDYMFSLQRASNYVFLAMQTEQAWWLPSNEANDTVHLGIGAGTSNVTVYGELHCSWAPRSQTTIKRMVSVDPGVEDSVDIFGLRSIGAAEAVNQPGMGKMPRSKDYTWLDVVADVEIKG